MNPYAKDSTGKRPEIINGTVGSHQSREELEAENARLRRLLNGSAKQAPSSRRPFKGWR